MNTIFETVTTRLAERRAERDQAQIRPRGRGSRCHCRSPIFFNNSFCLACHATLGYVPALLEVRSFRPGPVAGEWWLAAKPGEDIPAVAPVWRRCANFDTPAGCNWMVPAADPAVFCPACRLNRIIPDLSVPENAARWHKIEAAKRRLVAQLLELGLPVISKPENPWQGLAFDFLATPPGLPRVLTGHLEGVITLNIEEADDIVREQIRSAMNEPNRTLLGHLRHEVAHHYWDQLIARAGWLEPFRLVFGDERADYAAALNRNYACPPPPDWPLRHVTAYASVHPWEDWAETWAHYLQIVDTLATAVGFGLGAADVDFEAAPFTRNVLHDPGHPGAEAFLAMINAWVELTAVLNELSRSLGQRDLCPSVLSTTAVAKLHFVHLVVSAPA
jgi:hypothetical protein